MSRQKEHEARFKTLCNYYGTDEETLIVSLVRDCWFNTQMELTDKEKVKLHKLFEKYLSVE